MKECEYCHQVLMDGQECDCPEAKKAERKQRAVSEIMLEVKSLQDQEILILKENTENFIGIWPSAKPKVVSLKPAQQK